MKRHRAPEKPGAFILRNIEPSSWAAFKERAASEGHSLTWIIRQLVAYYVAHGLPRETK